MKVSNVQLAQAIAIIFIAALAVSLIWYWTNITNKELGPVPFDIVIDDWHCISDNPENCTIKLVTIHVTNLEGGDAANSTSYLARKTDGAWTAEGPIIDIRNSPLVASLQPRVTF